MRKYSKAQEVYLLAKAHLETLDAQEKELERQYIVKNGIKNPDGSVPERIYCIENEDAFNKANEATAKMAEESGLWAEILEARELLKQAEQNLIDWGLSRVKKDLPKGAYATLQRGIKQYKIRQELIALTMKLAV